MMFAIVKHNMRFAAWLALVALWCMAQPARDVRAVSFEFEYADPGDQGFFDPVLGPARRTALEYAGDVWGSLIPTAYVGEVITVHVSYADLGAGNPRASTQTGYQYPAPTMANTHFPKALANHLSGMDVDPDKDEITIQFNSNLPANYWYYGLDGKPSPTETDFVSTSMHEMGHGLGFTDSFRPDGSYGVFGDGTFNPNDEISGLPTIYDQFVTLLSNGTRLLDYPQAQRAIAVVSDNVYWNGTQATAANGGNPAQLYAPTTYSSGSTLSHVEDSYTDALMQPARPAGKAIHAPMAFERGMLRDMGWNIAIAPASLTWSGLGADNLWTTAQNWSGGQTPQGGDSVAFGPSPQTDVDIQYETGGAGYMFLGAITFPVDAPSYTLRFKSQSETNMTGSGIINFSSNAQTIFLESSSRDDLTWNFDAATLTFTGPADMAGANAGDADYHLRGGDTRIVSPPMSQSYFERNPGASISFENNATAGTASFEIEGGSGDGGPNAQVTFRQNSSAAAAEFRTKGGRYGPTLPVGFIAGFSGQVRFEDNSKAGLATFHNEGQAEYFNGAGGFTVFTDSSTAESAEIHNHGATYGNGIGGGTFFYHNSTAGAAHITNHADGSNGGSVSARTVFQDSSNAGTATIENEGSPSQAAQPGRTEFRNNSSAANATINNRGYLQIGHLAGRTLFYDSASAANATLRTYDGYSDHGRIEFRNQSTAASAQIFIENEPMNTATAGGYLNFFDNSSAAQSEITLRAGTQGTVQFYNNATAANAQIITETGVGNPGNIFFNDNSTAANANISLGESSYMAFYSQSTAADAIISLANKAQVNFSGGSAGQANITAAGGSVYTAGSQAIISFIGTSTAANSTITVNGATATLASPAAAYITGGASAGNATLIANGGTNGGAGGTIVFNGAANGSTARLIANAGGLVDFFSQSIYNDISFGSIEGAGTFYLRGAHVITGSRNTSTTVSGPIVDTLVYPTYTGGRITKVGAGTLTLAGTNTYTGLTTVNAGTLSVTGSITGGAVVNNGGTLNGTGTIGGTVTVNSGGVFSPGLSPGTITIGGLTMMPGGTLNVELGDPTSDHIVVTGGGSVSLAGTLNITLLDGFMPPLGSQFDLFTFASYSGDFTNYTGLNVGGNLALRPVFTSNSLVLSTRPEVDGDINTDGTVDIFDVNSVSANWGTAGPAGDANGDGIVDIFDVNLISSNWGATGSGGAAAVPEPASLALLTLGGLVGAALGHRRAMRPTVRQRRGGRIST